MAQRLDFSSMTQVAIQLVSVTPQLAEQAFVDAMSDHVDRISACAVDGESVTVAVSSS